MDHDGSFQELLLSSASRVNHETLRLAEIKRRTRLERQRRLSTLREGGSQSEEDVRNISVTCKYSNLTDNKLQQHFKNHQSLSNVDEVFVTDCATPLRSPTDTLDNMTPLGETSVKIIDDVTPLRMTTAKLENVTPLSGTPAVRDDNTPLRTTNMKLDDLSLTPALQLVHAMCQRSARMFSEQSPSLEELLRSASASATTPETFRTSMPLAGLIGRKMGLGKVDIPTELKKRNLRHILAVILNHLSPEDIYRSGSYIYTKTCK